MPQKLQRTEERLKLALESAKAGIWDYSPEDGSLECDDRMRSLLGAAPDEAISWNGYLERVHPEDRDRLHALMLTALQPGSGGEFRADFRLAPSPSRDERWLESRGRVLFDQGRANRFVGTVIDITEQKRSAALVERAARRSAVVAGVGEVLSSTIDYETTLINVISLCLPALGDFGFFDVVEPDGVRRISQAFADPHRNALLARTRWARLEHPELNLCALSSGDPAIHPRVDEAWLGRAASNEAHLALMRELSFGSLLTVPLRYQGQLLGALTLFYNAPGRRHDTEDLETALEVARRASAALVNARLYRDAQEAVRTRDEFLSIASHELKTPLTSAQLHVSGLLRYVSQDRNQLDMERLRERLNRTHVQLGRITGLIEQLLDVSLMSHSPPALRPEHFDLRELAEEVASRFEVQLERSACELVLQGDDAVRGQWDRGRIDQALTNLLANAIKYGPGKPVEVSVSAEGGVAKVTVRDHGVGIHPRDHARIFDRFERAVSSRNYGGLGLGLWIARQSAELHGGGIAVDSALGHGATFIITLPGADARELAS